MIEDEFLTYDELLADPPEWARVSQHAAFAQNGVLVVDLPGLDGIAIKPGQQLNYQTNDEGHVVAYSLGRAEETASSTPEPETAGGSDDSRTEPPAPSGDGKITAEQLASAEKHVVPPAETIEDAVEKADEHLAKKAAAKPAVGRKGATK